MTFLVLACLIGCQNAPSRDGEPSREPPRGPTTGDRDARPALLGMQAELERLRAEAGLDTKADPAAASGDLAADIEAFTTLDACVRARAPSDPVLADAIESLGYETLTRDACRVVEALKKRDVSPCRDIASSVLRMRCETGVATVTGNAGLCPTTRTGVRIEARDPTCLARAGRDERLCAAAMSAERDECRALVRGDPAECGRDARCRRQVARTKGLLERPKPRTPLPASAHVDFVASGRATSMDLADVAGAGVLLRRAGNAFEIIVGTPPGPLWPSWDAKGASARLYVDVTVSPEAVAKGPVRVASPAATLDLLVPGVGLLSGITAKKIEIVKAELLAEPGAKLELEIATELRDGTRAYEARIAVVSFVRDVVGR